MLTALTSGCAAHNLDNLFGDVAWRTRFMVSVSESIMSEALLVAESIAVMRAACSAATDSSMRAIELRCHVLRQQAANISAGLLVDVVTCAVPNFCAFVFGFLVSGSRRLTPASSRLRWRARALPRQLFGLADIVLADLLDRQDPLDDHRCAITDLNSL